jgi:hypothetical protein
VGVWLHRFHRRVLLVDSGSLAKGEVSEKIFLVGVRCDSYIGNDPIDADVETMTIGQ